MRQCQRAPWGVPFFALEALIQLFIIGLEIAGLSYIFKNKKPNFEDGVVMFILAIIWFFVCGCWIFFVLMVMAGILAILLLIIDIILIIIYLITLCYCCQFTPKTWWEDFNAEDPPYEGGDNNEDGEDGEDNEIGV